MYDTIEDKTLPTRGTIEREPLYQELQDSARQGLRANRGVGMELDDEDVRARYEMTSLDNGQILHSSRQPGEYYEVPVKTIRT